MLEEYKAIFDDEINDYGIKKLSIQKINERKQTYIQQSSLDFMIDENDTNDMGEQIYKELYCTDNKKILQNYEQNAGVTHLLADDKLSAVSAIA